MRVMSLTVRVDPEVGRFPSPQGNSQFQITGNSPPGREMENFQSSIWDTKQSHRMLKLLQFVAWYLKIFFDIFLSKINAWRERKCKKTVFFSFFYKIFPCMQGNTLPAGKFPWFQGIHLWFGGNKKNQEKLKNCHSLHPFCHSLNHSRHPQKF